MNVDAFLPDIGGGGKLSVTGTSQQLSLPANSGSIEITNTSSAETFFFQQAPPATTAVAPNNPTAVVDEGYYVWAGQCKVIRLHPGVTKIAYIGTGTGTARYCTGSGI